jgi:ComF family protein
MWTEARRPLRFVLDSLAALLFPSACRICSAPLVRLSQVPACDDCLDSLAPSHVIGCSVCGEAIDTPQPEIMPVCALCRRAHPHFDFAVSYGAYDGALRGMVHLLKYEQVRPAAAILGAKLAASVARQNISDAEPVAVVPVPLHRKKRRQRGFNQAELIAKSMLRELESKRFELQTGIQRRVRPTVSQTGLTRPQRRENVRGAFEVSRPEMIRGRTVMVIDDVYTTGTALNECARVLRRAGAKRVVVATVARVYRSSVNIESRRFEQEEQAAVLAEGIAAG